MASLCEVVLLVPDKSVAWRGLSVARMNSSVDLPAPTGGVCVGVTLTVGKVGSVLSKVLDRRRASGLLNLSDHFWSNSSILASAEDLEVRDLTDF